MKLNFKAWKAVRGYAAMLLGCLMYALSLNLFLAPHAIVAGGISGVSVMVNFLNPNVQIGFLTILLNLPILALAIKFLGWRFVGKCLITILSLGLLTDLFPALLA